MNASTLPRQDTTRMSQNKATKLSTRAMISMSSPIGSVFRQRVAAVHDIAKGDGCVLAHGPDGIVNVLKPALKEAARSDNRNMVMHGAIRQAGKKKQRSDSKVFPVRTSQATRQTDQAAP